MAPSCHTPGALDSRVPPSLAKLRAAGEGRGPPRLPARPRPRGSSLSSRPRKVRPHPTGLPACDERGREEGQHKTPGARPVQDPARLRFPSVPAWGRAGAPFPPSGSGRPFHALTASQ